MCSVSSIEKEYMKINLKTNVLVQYFKHQFYAVINFIHNRPPRAPPGICTKKFAPTLGLLHPSFCPGGFVGAAPKGQAFVYKLCLLFLKFHHNGKNWRLTTLWGLSVALKFYTLLKKIIQS